MGLVYRVIMPILLSRGNAYPFTSLFLIVTAIYSEAPPGGDRKPASRGARVAIWIILGICVLNLLFAVGTYLWGEAILAPMFGVSLIYKIVLGLGVLAAVLTAGALIYTVLAWKDGYWGVASRAYYTLVTVAVIAFVWFLNYWNLLGWRF